jgi:hypothetical protein
MAVAEKEEKELDRSECWGVCFGVADCCWGSSSQAESRRFLRRPGFGRDVSEKDETNYISENH